MKLTTSTNPANQTVTTMTHGDNKLSWFTDKYGLLDVLFTYQNHQNNFYGIDTDDLNGLIDRFQDGLFRGLMLTKF